MMSRIINQKIDLIRVWNCITPAVRNMLLVGSVGSSNLLSVFRKLIMTIPSANSNCADMAFALAKSIIWAAWEYDVCNYNVLNILSSVESLFGCLSQQQKYAIKNICRFANIPLPIQTSGKRCLSDMPVDECAESPFLSLNWFRRVKTLSSIHQMWDRLDKLLCEIEFPSAFDFIKIRFMLDSAIIQGDFERARSLVRLLQVNSIFSTEFVRYMLGTIAFLEGNYEGALEEWLRYIIYRPWDVNTILRIYDIATNRNKICKLPSGKVSICLYSYNKCGDLNVTLRSLFDAQLGDASIFVLINGSTDGSIEISQCWRERFGKDRFHIISLPVNIGAPAARNWLMHDDKVRKSEWIVFLDDDVIVPRDWLGRLGAMVELYPEGGAYGCKVVDSETPYLMQSVDYHLVKSENKNGVIQITPYRWSTLHYQVEDFGWFCYIRPCIHVTGCCHLFHRDVLLKSGDFDLRYSPSQFDDIDHDFRMALLGRPAIYNGFLTVFHMNNTAKLQRRNKEARSSGYANYYKLMNKFVGEPFKKMHKWEVKILWKDFMKKLHMVQQLLNKWK